MSEKRPPNKVSVVYSWGHRIGTVSKLYDSDHDRTFRAFNRKKPDDSQFSYLSLNRRTGGLLGTEKKFVNFAMDATSIQASTGCASAEFNPTFRNGAALTQNCLNACAMTNDPSSRDGKTYHVVSLEIKGFVMIKNYEAQTNPQVARHVSVYMVLDRQTNGTPMNSEDCFENAAAGAGATSLQWMKSMPVRKLEWNKRFRVLKELHFTLDTHTLTQTAANSYSCAPRAVPFHIFQKYRRPITVNCKAAGTTGICSDILDNSIHLIAFQSNDPADADPTDVQILYAGRMRFIG